MFKSQINRRDFVAQTSAGLTTFSMLSTQLGAIETSPIPHLATGIRIGEVTDQSAVIWVRLTRHPERNRAGRIFERRKDKITEVPAELSIDELEGACPGMSGDVRITYAVENLSESEPPITTSWIKVDSQTDFSHKFVLNHLRSASKYKLTIETRQDDRSPSHAPFLGQFETAPAASQIAEVQFCVMTCQGYPDRGHVDGHGIYPAMQALNPQFACLTGDLVYYDNDEPQAVNIALAQYHWDRMFSLPRLIDFTRNCGCYWLKDDHDTLDNDSWPGRTMGQLKFQDGQKLFQQQAPLRAEGPSFRSFRWGKDLQIWLTDGRDFRSPNTIPDGPEKSIWGAEQKAWFKRTIAESDATWKILISPTPLVGPDRNSKQDNHSNPGFEHEGNEIRQWLYEHVRERFFVICGDRHWQYHSVHPQTEVHEFGVGPASDEHAGGTPGENRSYHRFHRVAGGFLYVQVRRQDFQPTIQFQLRAVNGQVVYEWLSQLGG